MLFFVATCPMHEARWSKPWGTHYIGHEEQAMGTLHIDYVPCIIEC